MYFAELTLENIRCFGPKQTLKLTDADGKPAMWTVILGENGTGKTTLLQALVKNKVYSSIFSLQGMEILSEKAQDYSEKINNNVIPSLQENLLNISKNQGIVQNMFIDKPLSYFNRAGKNSLYHVSYLEPGVEHHAVASAFVCDHEGEVYLENKDAAIGILIVASDNICMSAYGATRRSKNGSLEADIGRCETLFDNFLFLRSAKDWLAQTHHAALMAKGDKKRGAERRLAQVKELLVKVLPDVHAIEFDATDDPIPQIKVMFQTDYGLVELENLSHGYQTMIAWMTDFASRLVETYPDSPNPLAEPAVCLVDEIDLHLHPRWQRDIIAYLTNLFPKTQFIVTAHSPLIVQSAEKANVVVLRKNGDHVVIENDKRLVQGWRIDQILTSDLFGLDSARPPGYARMLEERRVLLSKKRRSKADKLRLAELDAALDAMPAGESATDREAMDIIRRAAERLKRQEEAGEGVV